MPLAHKRHASHAAISLERGFSDSSMRPDEQVLGRCGVNNHEVECLQYVRQNFDALKDDHEEVACCQPSMSAATLLQGGSDKASVLDSGTQLLSEGSDHGRMPVDDEGRWSVLFDQQRREIERVLVKWLNAEVRDRLESIDRRLGKVHQLAMSQGSGMTHQSLKKNATRSASGLIANHLGSPQQTFSCSGSRLTGFLSARDWQSMSSMAMKRQEHIEATIRNHVIVRGRCAATAWRFMEDRFSSSAAYMWSFVVPSVVIMSLVVSFWQTVDNYPLRRIVGQSLQSSFEIIFVVELLLRFFVCPDRRTFCLNPFNVIDLLTCLPLGFRLGFAIASANVEDLFPPDILLPVLRLLKLTRRFEKFQLLLNAFMIALEALPVLLYTMVIIAVTFSGMIYAVEPRGNIANLPQAIWFVMVTMTTCGYGDITPSTFLGQIITSLLMVVSILYTAMPIGIVGNAFSQAWDIRDRLLLMQRIREAFLQRGFSEKAFRDIVSLFVGDCDNELGFDEFQTMLQVMNINITADRVEMLLHDLDEDGSGRVSVDELLGGLFPQDYVTYFRNLKAASTRNDSSQQGAGSSTNGTPKSANGRLSDGQLEQRAQ